MVDVNKITAVAAIASELKLAVTATDAVSDAESNRKANKVVGIIYIDSS